MSLTTAKGGSVILGMERHRVCLEVAWELEALAYVLPAATTNCTPESLQAGFVVRGIASRFLTLASVLLAALNDDSEETADLKRRVLVTQDD